MDPRDTSCRCPNRWFPPGTGHRGGGSDPRDHRRSRPAFRPCPGVGVAVAGVNVVFGVALGVGVGIGVRVPMGWLTGMLVSVKKESGATSTVNDPFRILTSAPRAKSFVAVV